MVASATLIQELENARLFSPISFLFDNMLITFSCRKKIDAEGKSLGNSRSALLHFYRDGTPLYYQMGLLV